MEKVHDMNELDLFIWENRDKLIVLYFGATWCGPCQKLKARLVSDELLKEMPLIKTVYIDVDDNELSDIVEIYKINSLPTQIFITLKYNDSDENEIVEFDRLIGYDWIKFKLIYQQYISTLKKNEK